MSQHLLKLIRFLIPAIAVLGLAACGGSGSSSSGASSGSAFDSSLVVQIDDPDRFVNNEAMLDTPFTLAGLLSYPLISEAFAEAAGIPIYIDGVESGVTDASGMAVIPIGAGTYLVCIGEAGSEADERCAMVPVAPDSVVIVDGSTMSVTTDHAIVLHQDPHKSHKTLVCHKGQTLSVGTPAAQAGHQAHGDTLGACPDDTAVAKTDPDEEEEDEEDEDEDGSGKPEKSSQGKNNRPDKNTS